jgi:NitT/TauT family transport system permease protein
MITTKLMVGVLLLSLLGLLFNRGLQWLEQKLVPWK